MDLKTDLTLAKNKIDTIESQLEGQIKDLEERERKWTRLEGEVNNIIKVQSQVVLFNIGGKKFATSTETLLKTPDTLFYRIVTSKKFDLNEEVFFDRSPVLFPYILDFLRTKKITYKRFSKDELKQLQVEAEYYEIGEINEYLSDLSKAVEFISMTYAGPYIHKGVTAGLNTKEALYDKEQSKGICCTTPGWIVVELKNQCEFEELTVGGYKGNSTLWYPENGAGASILTSTDKTKWEKVANIPSGYGSKLVKVKCKKSLAKFIKFEYSSYLGLGYLDVIKINYLK